MIRIENVQKQYGDIAALRGVTLRAGKSDILGIVGMSGAGKSTLLRCITLLEKPTSGAIFLDGEDLTILSDADLTRARRKLGVVFQGYPLLMQSTARDNVAFPLRLCGMKRAESRARASELLALVGLSDKEDAYPAQLSGGQCQRVAIARALANDPKVILCDEPTSALDTLSTQSVLDLLRSLRDRLGVTIIIITHSPDVVRTVCDRVAVIDEGVVIEEGATQDVLAHPKNPKTKQLLKGGEKV